MGKPFQKEIGQIYETIKWASEQSILELEHFLKSDIDIPLFIVGSGGSLSACYLACDLSLKYGIIAKAITPLELYYVRDSLYNSKVLFISASGKNNDILFAFELALLQEPNSIAVFCMNLNTPLATKAKNNSISLIIEYKIPTKKDGFLATNSLIAYFTMLCCAYNELYTYTNLNNIINNFNNEIEIFLEKINKDFTFIVLHGGWGKSVAIDIESKCTEAALGNVILTDYRNFGHGRHHWFAKRGLASAIITIETPNEAQIAQKTLTILPDSIPVLRITSPSNYADATIELLFKSFHFVKYLGELQNIDPGKPGVPVFGSKLYHLKYSSFYKSQKNNELFKKHLYIKRKTGVNNYESLNETEKIFWEKKYDDFTKNLYSQEFGIIIFDYDETLCSNKDRENGATQAIIFEIVRLLNENIVVGIATGRGKSAREDLQKWIPKKFYNNVVIGYYNGSDVGTLDDLTKPDKKSPPHPKLLEINLKLKQLKESFQFLEFELRPLQITLKLNNCPSSFRIKDLIKSIILKPGLENIQMVESSHSIDLIVKPIVSKLNIVSKCMEIAQLKNKSTKYLAIGDRGNWVGNDFELLSTKYSLSVDKVSPDPDSCWNLAPVGIKNIDATIIYLKQIITNQGNLKFNKI